MPQTLGVRLVLAGATLRTKAATASHGAGACSLTDSFIAQAQRVITRQTDRVRHKRRQILANCAFGAIFTLIPRQPPGFTFPPAPTPPLPNTPPSLAAAAPPLFCCLPWPWARPGALLQTMTTAAPLAGSRWRRALSWTWPQMWPPGCRS